MKASAKSGAGRPDAEHLHGLTRCAFAWCIHESVKSDPEHACGRAVWADGAFRGFDTESEKAGFIGIKGKAFGDLRPEVFGPGRKVGVELPAVRKGKGGGVLGQQMAVRGGGRGARGVSCRRCSRAVRGATRNDGDQRREGEEGGKAHIVHQQLAAHQTPRRISAVSAFFIC
jgi:hypothetical protein